MNQESIPGPSSGVVHQHPLYNLFNTTMNKHPTAPAVLVSFDAVEPP